MTASQKLRVVALVKEAQSVQQLTGGLVNPSGARWAPRGAGLLDSLPTLNVAGFTPTGPSAGGTHRNFAATNRFAAHAAANPAARLFQGQRRWEAQPTPSIWRNPPAPNLQRVEGQMPFVYGHTDDFGMRPSVYKRMGLPATPDPATVRRSIENFAADANSKLPPKTQILEAPNDLGPAANPAMNAMLFGDIPPLPGMNHLAAGLRQFPGAIMAHEGEHLLQSPRAMANNAQDPRMATAIAETPAVFTELSHALKAYDQGGGKPLRVPMTHGQTRDPGMGVPSSLWNQQADRYFMGKGQSMTSLLGTPEGKQFLEKFQKSSSARALRVVALVKEAGFWNWADNIASFIPVVGSIKDFGKGVYHTATGQHGKAMGDFAWAGAGLIPGGSFARGGAKLVGTAGMKALGLGARHAGIVGHGLRAGTMAGVGTAGDVAGGMLQPQPAAPQPVAPQPQAPMNTPWNVPVGSGFNMPNQPQFGAPQPTAFQQPDGYGDQMAGYGGLLRAFAGNGFGNA